MLLCACMGSYVFNWMNFKNVSAYIFHDAFFFSFKRVLVQGRRPCFRRLYRRLCFVKCKRLHFLPLCTLLDRIGQRLDKWTELDKIGHRLDKSRTELDKNGQSLSKMDKSWKNGQIWTTVDKIA